MERILFSRECPRCHKTISYKTYSSYQSSKSRKSTCMACRPGKKKATEEEKSLRKRYQKEYNQAYRKVNKEKIRKQKQEYADKIKQEGIIKYGGKCSCCHESEFQFLTLEHKNGRDKNDNLTGKKAWAKVKSLGYPDSYTVLCFNCNCCKGIYGICAHKKIQTK